MNHPEQCHEMKKLRRQLYTSTPEGQNLIARRISEHVRDCEQCAEWWESVWEKSGKEVPAHE
jgi:predicted anti-sigma-YlaC factor YlaD